MWKNICFLGIVGIILFTFSSCQPKSISSEDMIISSIDSILTDSSRKPFNGVVLVQKKGKTIYSKTNGFANISTQQPIQLTDQFVIGSISKQITAALILQEYEKDNLKFNDKIRVYFPDLKPTWADSVTIHHLLAHTHGIVSLDQPLAFEAGSQFQYSQLGYDLLAQIIEKITNQSFENISTALFRKCGMMNTFHPKDKNHQVINGYTEINKDSLILEKNSLENYAAAGAFISTASDLSLWNNLLHSGQILADSTFKIMTTRYATRQHPIFDKIEYGYGLLFKKGENEIKIGALGFAPAFVSASYFLPKTQVSIVILENIAKDLNDFRQVFYYHTAILARFKNL